MPNIFCPSCQRKLLADASRFDREARCPACKYEFVLSWVDEILNPVIGFSSAHLLLLSKFMRPKPVEDFSNRDYWTTALRESAENAISRLEANELIARQGIAKAVSYKFTVEKLKELLKSRGQPVFGRKDALISRLLENDKVEIENLVSGIEVYECTPKGVCLANQYLEVEKEKQLVCRNRVKAELECLNFLNASRLVAAFEAQQVFPRGLNIDWKNSSHDAVVQRLDNIFKSKPAILGSLNQDQFDVLHVAAAMMDLFGSRNAQEWMPENFETGLFMDNDAAARMILFSEGFRSSLELMRIFHRDGTMKVKYIAISRVSDSCSCEACAVLDKTHYYIDNMPELPHEKCTSVLGCRCMMLPQYDLRSHSGTD